MTHLKSKKTLNLKTLLSIPIFLYMLVISAGFFPLFFNSKQFFNEITVMLSLGLGLLLIIALQFSRRYLFHQMAVIAFFFLVFILPRIVTYLYLPSIVVWPFGNDIDAGTVNAGLSYVLIGTMFFIIGMTIANKVFQPYLPRSSIVSGNILFYPTKVFVTLLLIIVAFQLFVQVIAGISPYGNMRFEKYNTLFQFFKIVLNLDGTFFLVFATLLFRNMTDSKSRWISVIMVVFCYLFLTSLGGSRVGALRVLIFLIISLIIIRGNFRIRIGEFCRVIFLLGALGLLSFPSASMNRAVITAKSYSNSHVYDYAVAEANNLRTIRGLISPVLNRLGCVLDYPVLIVTQEANPEAKEKYMNFLYSAKNIINMLVPGNPFPEAMIMTSRVVDVIYRGANEPSMYSGYFSEFWSLWGLAYVFFGWQWGLLAILFVGFIVHSFYALIVIRFSGLFQFYLRLWLLYYVSMGIMFNMGLDDAFTTSFFGLLQFAAFYFSLRLVHFFYFLFGNSLKQLVKPKERAQCL